jgi:hypothetical protein
MNKRRPPPSATATSGKSEAALFVELGEASPKELRRLHGGSGPLMRQIEQAIERWRTELDLEAAAGVVPVILLYRRKESAEEE